MEGSTGGKRGVLRHVLLYRVIMQIGLFIDGSQATHGGKVEEDKGVFIVGYSTQVEIVCVGV